MTSTRENGSRNRNGKLTGAQTGRPPVTNADRRSARNRGAYDRHDDRGRGPRAFLAPGSFREEIAALAFPGLPVEGAGSLVTSTKWSRSSRRMPLAWLGFTAHRRSTQLFRQQVENDADAPARV
jgi:hypothetical protein